MPDNTEAPGRFFKSMLGILILVAFSIAALSGYIVLSAEQGEYVPLNQPGTFSIILASITLNIALATIIPYFISASKIKNESERAARVEVSGLDRRIHKFGDDLDELKQDHESHVKSVKDSISNAVAPIEDEMSTVLYSGRVANWSVDAHLSRMVAFFLYRERNFMWSIGWSARSLKRYIKLIKNGRGTYAEFFVFNLKVIEQAVYEIVAEVKREQAPEQSLEASIEAVMKKNIAANQSYIFEQGGPYRPALRAFKDVLDALVDIDQKESREDGEADGQRRRIIDYECFDGTGVYTHVENLRIAAPLLAKISLKTDPSYRVRDETQLDAFISDVKDISAHKGNVEAKVRAYANAETFEEQLERFYTRIEENEPMSNRQD